MVALPNAPGIVRLALKGSYGGGTWENIHHLKYTGAAPNTAALDSVATAAASAWAAHIAALCTSVVHLTDIEVTDLTTPFSAQTAVSLSDPGTRGGTPLTASVCCVVSWKVNFRFRGGHPRSYLPAGAAADITNNRLWASGFVTEVTGAANDYLTALNAISVSGDTYQVVFVSYFAAKALRTTPLSVPLNNGVIHGRVDTQRRRLGRETP